MTEQLKRHPKAEKKIIGFRNRVIVGAIISNSVAELGLLLIALFADGFSANVALGLATLLPVVTTISIWKLYVNLKPETHLRESLKYLSQRKKRRRNWC